MLDKIITFSIRQAGIVLGLALLLLGLAAQQARNARVDVFPELNAPQVVILTEAKGMHAGQVETQISTPLESTVNGLPGVRRVRSASAMSLSLIHVEFDWKTDIYRARQMVSEAIQPVLPDLPEQAHAELAPISGLIGEVQIVALHQDPNVSTPIDIAEMRSWAEFELRQRLLAIAGVSQVVAVGGILPEVQILPNPEALQRWQLSIRNITEQAELACLIHEGGYLPDYHGREQAISLPQNDLDLERLRNTPVAHIDGHTITLADVAEVRMGATPPRGSASLGDSEAVLIAIKKAPNTNTLQINRDIDKTLENMRVQAPAGVIVTSNVFQQSDFIKRALHNLQEVLRDAAILVGVIMIIFLLNWRTALITLTAIPVSLAIAFLLLNQFGFSLNVMTLGGMAIAIGELVDDAIIDVENIYKRLRENAQLPEAERLPAKAVIRNASNEVRSAVVFATLMICLVMMPLLFLNGIEGRFFQPMGLTYIVSIMASLLVALTLVPALSCLLLRNTRLKGDNAHSESWLARHLQALYMRVLNHAMSWRKTIILASFIALLGCLGIASRFGQNFLPQFQEGTLMVAIYAPPGTSLTESERLTKQIGIQLMNIEGVAYAARRTGRAERDEHAHGVDISEYIISLEENANVLMVKERLDTFLSEIPGLRSNIGAPISHQISSILSGSSNDLTILFYGQNMANLRAATDKAERTLRSIEGTRDIIANRDVMLESWQVVFSEEKSNQWLGVAQGHITAQIQDSFAGTQVGKMRQGIRKYPVMIRFEEYLRNTPDDLRNLRISSANGDASLGSIAEVRPTQIPMAIQHENGLRKAQVSLNIAEGASMSHVEALIQEAVAPIAEEYNLSWAIGGQLEARRSAAKTLYLWGSVTIIGVAMLLYTCLHSLRATFLVLINFPLAFMGGILAIALFQNNSLIENIRGILMHETWAVPSVSIASMVGFITLFGIAIRNGLLLASRYREHLLAGYDLKHAIKEGSKERLIPILMTALTAILGMLPLAMRLHEPGAELLAPLALVVLGGLITSTFLNLIVLPIGYAIVFQNHKPLQKGFL